MLKSVVLKGEEFTCLMRLIRLVVLMVCAPVVLMAKFAVAVASVGPL